MRPRFSSFVAHSSSSSSPTDRRLNALARHLIAENSDPSSAMAPVSASPTSASNGLDSVFAHIVQAPEDPILGVFYSILFFFAFMHCVR
uniref:Uncharacterized protein n=1 Tax=Cannabis sativa TaxID=3483 RepID=A0A803QWG9_CANSA